MDLITSKVCECCNNKFEVRGKKEIIGKRFCNHKCYSNSRIKFKDIECLYCKNKFSIQHKYASFIKFCNEECIEKYNLINKIKYVEKNCIVCNTRSYVKKGVKTSNFCNAECKNKNNYDKFKIKKNCIECGNEYEVHKNRKNDSKFCTVSCSSKYNSREQGFGIVIKPEFVWNKGLTREIDERIKNMSEKRQKTWMINYSAGRIVMYFSGKKLTEKHKRNIAIGTSRALINGMGFKYGQMEDLNHITRSSWEVNFARILKYLNRSYLYEPKYFELSNNKFYIPDFYDEKRKCWYEVKGFIKPGYLDKFNMFKKEYPNEKITLIDYKVYRKLIKIFKNDIVLEKPQKYKARKKME